MLHYTTLHSLQYIDRHVRIPCICILQIYNYAIIDLVTNGEYMGIVIEVVFSIVSFTQDNFKLIRLCNLKF